MTRIGYSLKIAKIPLCMLVAFSAFFGYCYAAGPLSMDAYVVFLSVFLLSCGGASLNSYQERELDGMMERTALRPMVSERLSLLHVSIQTTSLILGGLGILLWLEPLSFIAGLAGIISYNFVYTPLKRKSLFAIIPGALCGATPPYIGWLAAGADVFTFKAFMITTLLIFWQIPHFFLVLLNHKSDYLKGVVPNLFQRLEEDGMRRVFLPWITALVSVMLTFAVVPSNVEYWWRFTIVVNSMLLLCIFYYQLLWLAAPCYRFLFKFLNVSIFFQMLIVSISTIGYAT